jgi:hypothetical protein
MISEYFIQEMLGLTCLALPSHTVPHPPTDCLTPCGRKATTPTQCGSRFRMQGRLGRNNLSDPGQLYASHSLTRGGHANRAKP